MLPIRCSEREWKMTLLSCRVGTTAHEKRWETESLLTRQPLLCFEGQFPPACLQRGGTEAGLSLLEIRNALFTVRSRKTKPPLRESWVADIDTVDDVRPSLGFVQQKSTCCSSKGRGLFSLCPSLLPPIGATSWPPPNITCG